MKKKDPKTKTWINQLKEGNPDNHMILVLNQIKEYPGVSTKELRDQLRIPHQSLTPCLSYLMDYGIIKSTFKALEHDGKFYSCYIFVNNTQQMIKNQKKRLRIKFDVWVKRGLKDFVEFIDAPTLSRLQKCQESLKKAPKLEDIKINRKGKKAIIK